MKSLKDKVLKELKNVDLTYIVDNQVKKYTTSVETYIDAVYIKCYYEGDLNRINVDLLYSRAINWLTKINFRFQGINEYRDNHEVCLVFLKKEDN